MGIERKHTEQVAFVYPYVRPHVSSRDPLDRFWLNMYYRNAIGAILQLIFVSFPTIDKSNSRPWIFWSWEPQ
jgi:formate/nitrite transporter FocA (FNT family)